jgi:GDP/UDP-N,N'-diacetylbacillosamine 2-epimerase (hydrolysing)
MKKIAVITSTRAEYGILHPLIQRIDNDPELSLKLIVTGTHLSDKYGRTVSFIEKDGFPIAEEIPILEEENDAFHVSLTMANALSRFAACFRDMRPDMAVILGDRTEMLAVAEAAMIAGIPIAHLHGGELTEGAVDDCVRHSITKMSFLHFTSAEQYRKRVIQLGEGTVPGL